MKKLVLDEVLKTVVGRGTAPEERYKIRRFLGWVHCQYKSEGYVPHIKRWLRGSQEATGLRLTHGLPSDIAQLGWRKKRRLEGAAGDSTVRVANSSLTLNSDFLQGPLQVTVHLDPPSTEGSQSGEYRLVVNQNVADASFPPLRSDFEARFWSTYSIKDVLEDYLTMAMLVEFTEWLMGFMGPADAVYRIRALWAQFGAKEALTSYGKALAAQSQSRVDT